jgi:hypothetical protein
MSATPISKAVPLTYDFNPWTQARVDTASADRGPMLLVSRS